MRAADTEGLRRPEPPMARTLGRLRSPRRPRATRTTADGPHVRDVVVEANPFAARVSFRAVAPGEC